MSTLLRQFIEQEANPYVCKLIRDAVENHDEQSHEVKRRFEFNRFELTLDFLEKIVLIEDVLEPGIEGEFRVGLGEFMQALYDA